MEIGSQQVLTNYPAVHPSTTVHISQPVVRTTPSTNINLSPTNNGFSNQVSNFDDKFISYLRSFGSDSHLPHTGRNQLLGLPNNTTLVNRGLAAMSILASDAQNDSKIIELSKLGVQTETAKKVLGEFGVGSLNSALQLYQAINNWSSLNTQQQISVASQAMQSIGGLGQEVGLESAGIATGGVIGSISGVAGIVTGIDQAGDVIDAIGEMPRSQAAEAGAIGLGSAGASIGAGVAAIGVASGAIAGAQAGSAVVPVVGTVIGAAVGAIAGFALGRFGSGKSASQMLRDKWRDAMEAAGLAQKIDGSHHVKLSDGSLYNIGFDGGHQLNNLDGTTRHTFDVDWKNPLAVNGIPEAHLFVMASGLDPSAEKENLWHTAVSQAINAATFNATSKQDVTENFQSMLANKIDPRALGLKIEVLRVNNVIDDSEYLVYLNAINNIFSTQLTPTDRQKATEAVQRLQASIAPGENAL